MIIPTGSDVNQTAADKKIQGDIAMYKTPLVDLNNISSSFMFSRIL